MNRAEGQAFTLGFSDVSEFHKARLMTIFKISSNFHISNWRLVEDGPCDVVVSSNSDRPSDMNCKLVAVLTDETSGDTHDLSISVPISGYSVLKMLRRAEDMLSTPLPAQLSKLQVKRNPALQSVPYNPAHQVESIPQAAEASFAPANEFRPQAVNEFAREPVKPEFAEPTAPVEWANGDPRGWDDVAVAIYSVMQNPSPVLGGIDMTGYVPITIDFRYRALHWDRPIRSLPPAPLDAAFQSIMIEPDAPLPFNLPGQGLDALLWIIGKNAFDGEPAPWMRRDERYRLQRWPNFTELSHSLDHMRMTAQLGNAFLNAEELSVLSGMSRDETQRLLNAYSLMGLLQISVEARAAASAVAPTQPNTPAPTGLFGRLRKKLGL
jgi:hypothetical protein